MVNYITIEKVAMINYLHDIRNKLTLISGYTAILARKYGPDEFLPININVMRINDLVNDAYSQLFANELAIMNPTGSPLSEFLIQVDVLIDTLKLIFPIEIQNEVSDYRSNPDNLIFNNIDLILQIMENVIGNSINANATKIYIRTLEVDCNFIIELVDNGSREKSQESPLVHSASLIPNGIGTKIITKNMIDMNGKAEWMPRLDNSGMIVRLYFPMMTTLS